MKITSTHYAIKHPDGRYVKKDTRCYPTYNICRHMKILDLYSPDLLKAKWFKTKKQALIAADKLIKDYDNAVIVLKSDIDYTNRQLTTTHKVPLNQHWINELKERIKEYDDMIGYFIHTKPSKLDITTIESVHTLK